MIITKSNQVLNYKPKGGSIKKDVVNIVQLSFESLTKVVLQNAFNSSEASGIKEADWLSQQIFTLDFDSGIDPQTIIKRSIRNSLNPNIIYTTFSDSERCRKFRLLFILNEPIFDYKVAKSIMRGLMKIYPECDNSCKDLCRMYYPGKEVIFQSDNLNEKEWFTHYTQSQIAENIRYYEQFKSANKEIQIIEKLDWNGAIDTVKILKVFFSNRRVSYDILFGLITNAQYIKGGVDKILQHMRDINNSGGALYFPDEERGIEFYPDSYFYSLKAVRRFQYQPKALKNFSPFEDDWDIRNLLELKHKRGKVIQLESKRQISLKTAEVLLKKAWSLVKKDIPFTITEAEDCPITGEPQPKIIELDPLFNPLPKNPIWIFKITTGAGKSQVFLDEKEAIIALPFHTLKDEMSERMLVNHLLTPKPPHYGIDEIDWTISELRGAGLYSEVSKIIGNIAGGSITIKGEKIEINDGGLSAAYLEQNKKCRESESTVLTTHTRAINDLNFKHDTYIFDEDPLSDIVNIEAWDIDFTPFDGTKWQTFTKEVEDFLRNSVGAAVIKTPRWCKPAGFDKACAELKRGSLIKLLNSDLLHKDPHHPGRINFCLKKEFLPNKKVIIMSATIPTTIYKALFGDRVRIVDITNIKPMGVIEQWTKRSWSLTGMANYNTKIWNDLFSNIIGSKVITHAKWIGRFKNHLSLPTGGKHNYYFGNCSGGNLLSGSDVAVVGTPNKPQWVYLFLAELIGLPNSINQNMYDRVVDWGGFRFRFFTFDDPHLRDIQLSLIEAELLQAAGRSRFLRNPNTTKIFSDLPLKITTKFIEN